MSRSATTVLITGANGGIGYQTALALLQSSQTYKIFLGARSAEKANEAIRTLKEQIPDSKCQQVPVIIDIEDDRSIADLYTKIKSETETLDVLINNAGANFDQQTSKIGLTPREMFNKTWDLNVTGSHLLTTQFAPLLVKSDNARLIFLTSGLSSIAQSENDKVPFNAVPPAGWPKDFSREYPAYKSVKVGLNMLMRDWYRWLKNDNVKVWTVNPGLTATNLGGNIEHLKKIGAGDPKFAGQFIRSVVEGERDHLVGKTINAPNASPYGDILPW
ncbi:uncharacterized protein I303_104486 [Kwoniella dejecticola CBS 10117]|uniref:Short-chain dehydrogenase n=1 Tax=Kwoniella dejecticola CBS 10117 TaxID=1296121 RepID=A0A1A6A567_9TREE|nr:uncharacterized protein I303_04536 [Kwoniella dejecticola CBS 10117]OBR85204.1 hypothetical protein I303_04536 [Kwoniella dejecticola CBS 10117]